MSSPHGSGRVEDALDEVERAYREHSTLLGYLEMNPRLGPLRHEPAFVKLLARVGLGS